jgi:hypothetical protein
MYLWLGCDDFPFMLYNIAYLWPLLTVFSYFLIRTTYQHCYYSSTHYPPIFGRNCLLYSKLRLLYSNFPNRARCWVEDPLYLPYWYTLFPHLLLQFVTYLLFCFVFQNHWFVLTYLLYPFRCLDTYIATPYPYSFLLYVPSLCCYVLLWCSPVSPLSLTPVYVGRYPLLQTQLR